MGFCQGSSLTKLERCRLMVALMDRACQLSDLSRRKLARLLGVSVGTVNAYYAAKVDPLNSKLLIQQRLALLNGLTVDEMFAFYGSGDWAQIPNRLPVLGGSIEDGVRQDANESSWVRILGSEHEMRMRIAAIRFERLQHQREKKEGITPGPISLLSGLKEVRRADRQAKVLCPA